MEFIYSRVESWIKDQTARIAVSWSPPAPPRWHWPRWPPWKGQQDRREQERLLRQEYERQRRQLHDLCRAAKAESIADLQEILCSMVLAECVYKRPATEMIRALNKFKSDFGGQLVSLERVQHSLDHVPHRRDVEISVSTSAKEKANEVSQFILGLEEGSGAMTGRFSGPDRDAISFGTRYLLAEAGDTLFASFIGTKQYKDVITDANFFQGAIFHEDDEEDLEAVDVMENDTVDSQTNTEVNILKYSKGKPKKLQNNAKPAAHRGFLARAKGIPALEIYRLAQKKNRNLVLCGHSLGGAVAALATLAILRALASSSISQGHGKVQVKCITFSQPPVGNAALKDYVHQKGWQKYFKSYCIPEDLVPRLLSPAYFHHYNSQSLQSTSDAALVDASVVNYTNSTMQLQTLKSKGTSGEQLVLGLGPVQMPLWRLSKLVPLEGVRKHLNILRRGGSKDEKPSSIVGHSPTLLFPEAEAEPQSLEIQEGAEGISLKPISDTETMSPEGNSKTFNGRSGVGSGNTSRWKRVPYLPSYVPFGQLFLLRNSSVELLSDAEYSKLLSVSSVISELKERLQSHSMRSYRFRFHKIYEQCMCINAASFLGIEQLPQFPHLKQLLGLRAAGDVELGHIVDPPIIRTATSILPLGWSEFEIYHLAIKVDSGGNDDKFDQDPMVPLSRIVVLSNILNQMRMDKQDTPITVHLGRGARIQLANTVINTGSTGATIQFGSVDFSTITARTTVPRAHLPAPQITARDIPQGRISVFERLSQPETLTAKRVVDGRKVSVMTADTTALPRETVTSGIYDAEASSSGGKLNRRQRRKRNAELRAQQLSVPVHPSNIPAQELEATIPTQNGFSNLKWVKRNSSTGELKKSFWEQRREVPTPPKKKEPESLSARVYRVLRTVKEKGLTKKRFQRPLTADVRRTPPRERLSFTRVERRERRNNPLGEHRGVTPELHIRGSTTERSRWKGKQVWRPRPRRNDERKEREIDLGVTSGAASRRSASTNKQRQKWVQKKTHDDTYPDGRHLGEFSKGSHRSLTPPKKEVNFDRSPRVEEILIPNQEPEIHWRRRSEVQVQEEEYDDEDTMDVELVYMVSHIDDNDSDDEEDRRSQTREQARRRRRGARSVTSQSVRSSEEEGEEVEENPFAEETLTLAQMRRQMRRQMKEKDKEISHLNEKMTEMMTQMTTMMEMMQKATSVGPTPAQPINHAASIAPAKPPDPHVPQASGIKGTPEGGNEAVDNIRQRTLQNVASASEPDLLDRVAKFEKLNLSKSEGLSDKPKKGKASDARKGEAYSISPFKLDKKKQVIYDQGVYNADKGKQPMQYEEKPKQVYTPSSQPKLVLGGNDKPRTFSGGERPRQVMGTGDRTFPSLKDKMNKEKESTRVVTSSSVPPPKEAIKENSIQGEQWETVVSKKTTKMLKQLEGVPGVKWKSPTEPVLNLKLLPVPHASTSKQQLGQANSSKSEKTKSKSAKKKAKIKKPKKKKTATQRVIDSLGEYHQTARRPIKLGDFMTELKIDEEEEAEDKLLPTETCRVISATSEILKREKYAEEAAPEFCLMVSSMDYSSEEDLYFPKEDDTDPDIASQMEQVNLEDNSESTGESPDTTMADSEENTASNKSESDEVAQTEKRPKQGGEMRQRGRKRVTPTLPKAAATSKTKRVVPHLGSDTEEDEVIPVKARKNCQPAARGKKKAEDSDPDYDYESTYANSVQGIFSRRIDSLSVSDSVLVVTRIPLQHFKEVIPREAHNVEELVTFYVRPHKKKGGPGRLFYSVGKLNEEENRDWYRRIIDSEELLPTRLPRFNTKGIRRMLRKQINIPTSKRQLCFCLSIWYGRHPRPLRQKDAAARRGLGCSTVVEALPTMPSYSSNIFAQPDLQKMRLLIGAPLKRPPKYPADEILPLFSYPAADSTDTTPDEKSKISSIDGLADFVVYCTSDFISVPKQVHVRVRRVRLLGLQVCLPCLEREYLL
ncbi:hypothetical protein M5K25_025182 [Dendrobium thyrsiflorum]|uniref:Fungal lipase-type domain-containing protein n=1 Tax=Dendrobium thyrsiflorum TaxID=117978 RepID=A0ABD0U3X1_DENTH